MKTGFNRGMAALGLTVWGVAFAPTTFAADVQWNGFLNVVGGVLQHDPRVDFTPGAKQYPAYRDYSNDLSFDSQTSGGLQAKTTLDPQTSVTAQLYAEGYGSEYAAKLKWLFVTYTPTYNSTFRVGKIGSPFYYYSDFLNVGYAYHWISPPDTVYPFDTTITGVDYTYQDVGEHFDWSVEVLAGSSDEYYSSIQSQVTNHNSIGVVFNASNASGVSFRAMLYQTDSAMHADVLSPESLDANVNSAVDILLDRLNLPENIATAVRPSLVTATQAHLGTDWTGADSTPIRYAELALRSEWGRWMVMGECIGARNNNYLFNQATSAYLTAGVKVDRALFHITYSTANAVLNERAKEDLAMAVPTLGATPDEAGAYLASQIRSGYALLSGTKADFETIGVRYDVSTKTALKLDLTRVVEYASRPSETAGIGSNLLLRAAINATF